MMLRNIATVALLLNVRKTTSSGMSMAAAICGLYRELWSRRENPFGSSTVSAGDFYTSSKVC